MTKFWLHVIFRNVQIKFYIYHEKLEKYIRKLIKTSMQAQLGRSYGGSSLIEASLLWGDSRMFMQHVKMTRNELVLLSRCLSELSEKLPEKMKELFKWVEMLPEEIISLQQAEQVFAKCSALTESGKLKMSNKEFRNWNTAVPCCSTASELFSGSDNFRQTFKFAFCNFFRSFFRTSSYNCQNSLYFDFYLRDKIKDQVPITAGEAIQLLEHFINLNTGINHSESSVKRMSVLLARIYVTSIKSTDLQLTKNWYESNQ